jgi:hypothetical protein
MEDLSYGFDAGQNYALFIHAKHFLSEWEVDDQVKHLSRALKDATYFVVWYPEENRQGAHGWLENGEIIQWG